jgi:hypothetical protein
MLPPVITIFTQNQHSHAFAQFPFYRYAAAITRISSTGAPLIMSGMAGRIPMMLKNNVKSADVPLPAEQKACAITLTLMPNPIQTGPKINGDNYACIFLICGKNMRGAFSGWPPGVRLK